MVDKDRLVAQARGMQEMAYVPYSNFRVGAALLTEEGKIFTGCNVENSAYGVCICAEQTAVVKAVSEGSKSFVAVAVAGDSDGPCLPCGACRQVLSEFAKPDMVLYCVGKDGEVKNFTLGEILAYSFHLEEKNFD
ncbi:MAG: cytidine deaminase [Lachnospiraceae bacterium]|nr:cytidine deaminase [Lachnospiraceae bacterium]